MCLHGGTKLLNARDWRMRERFFPTFDKVGGGSVCLRCGMKLAVRALLASMRRVFFGCLTR